MSDEATDGAAAAAEESAREWEMHVAAAYSGAAPFANRFLMTRHDSMVRLSFVEQSAPMTNLHFRAAVTLNLGDVTELHEVLGRFLHTIRQELGMTEPPVGSPD